MLPEHACDSTEREPKIHSPPETSGSAQLKSYPLPADSLGAIRQPHSTQEPGPSCTAHQWDLLRLWPFHGPPQGHQDPSAVPGLHPSLTAALFLRPFPCTGCLCSPKACPSFTCRQTFPAPWALSPFLPSQLPTAGSWGGLGSHSSSRFALCTKRCGTRPPHSAAGPEARRRARPPRSPVPRPPLLTRPGRGVGPVHGVGPGHGAQPQPVLGAGVEVLEGVAGETSLG